MNTTFSFIIQFRNCVNHNYKNNAGKAALDYAKEKTK